MLHVFRLQKWRFPDLKNVPCLVPNGVCTEKARINHGPFRGFVAM